VERMMSVEDKIRRAEEIYNRRRENQLRATTAKVSINNKKDIKLLKKMIIQILICLIIYGIYYFIMNNNYIFSEDLKNKTKEVLSYDVNLDEAYSNIVEKIKWTDINEDKLIQESNSTENNNSENVTEQINDESKGVEEEQNVENINQENTQEQEGVEELINENTSKEEISQEEQDVVDIKNSIKFISPIEGTITSKFGWRNPITASVPQYHTGIDIGAEKGTVIRSATDGEVILASSQGDYGNHLKIQINDVEIIYAHCNSLYVSDGDQINQGQEIAEVGSTGNSTGPHLHFEIRKENRLVDPELILEI